jgi:hypothetical protein
MTLRHRPDLHTTVRRIVWGPGSFPYPASGARAHVVSLT